MPSASARQEESLMASQETSCAIHVDESTIALDVELAGAIFVKPVEPR